MTVSEVQLEEFVTGYLHKFSRLTSELSKETAHKIFPHFLIAPYKIIGIISNAHGLAIEFIEKAEKSSLRTCKVDERIENVVLPQKSTDNIAFAVEGRKISIGQMGVYTKEFLEKYVEKAEGTILKLEPPLEAFVRVSVGSDVIFYDIQFGAVLNERPAVRTVKGALWIFGSNLATDFTPKRAEERAIDDFNWFMGLAALQLPQFPKPAEITLNLRALSERMKEFRGLISKRELKEPELQSFFEKNPVFLSFGTKYRKLFPRIHLEKPDGEDLIPDFLLERVTDAFCDILDIKLPAEKVLAGSEERKRFTSEVSKAIAQVHEYREYFDEANNRRDVKKKYGLSVYKPDISVLIGSSQNVDVEDLITVGDRYRYVKVVTYDEILKQIEHLRSLLEKATL
jgi:hypothetical protein